MCYSRVASVIYDICQFFRKTQAFGVAFSSAPLFHPSLQNPKDCSKAKKLVCNINKGCGYGCQLHHVVYCFMIAYGTQRTLILESQNWRYATGGWETVFRPVSETCTDRAGSSTGHWSGKAEPPLSLLVLCAFAPVELIGCLFCLVWSTLWLQLCM